MGQELDLNNYLQARKWVHEVVANIPAHWAVSIPKDDKYVLKIHTPNHVIVLMEDLGITWEPEFARRTPRIAKLTNTEPEVVASNLKSVVEFVYSSEFNPEGPDGLGQFCVKE
jgi:hypothetical protein